MINFLSKPFLWGAILLLLHNGWGVAQPIQLLQQNGGSIKHEQRDVSLPGAQVLPEFWEGTPPSIIETYFSKLPLRLNSPVLRGLRDQITKEKYTERLQGPPYEKILLSLLIAEGKGEKAKELLMDTNTPEKEVLLLDLQWLEGDSRKACEKVTNLIRTSPQDEWKKQNIYCLYLNGEEERAKIAAEVLSESNPTAAQLLNALFDPSRKPSFDESVLQSPFFLTIWLERQPDIPESQLNKLLPSSLSLIARSKKAPTSTRLLAAEKALQQGTFTGKEFLTLLKEEPQTGFWGQLMQALKSPQTESLLPLLERAEQEDKLGLVGQVFGSSLSSLDPSTDTLPLSPFIIRAFLQSDKKELAKKWGKFYMREAPDEAIAIVPLLHLAFPENKWGESQIHAWQAYENRIHPKNAPQHSYEMRRILDGLAEPVGQPMKGEPSPPSWRQAQTLLDEQTLTLLNSAADSQRKGEVLLFVLALMGETPLQKFSVDKLIPLLKALDKAGYKEEARSLALEFLLVNQKM